MRKALLVAIILFSSIFPATTNASENFLLASEVTYEVLESGSTKISHLISLTNAVTEIHATDYTLALKGAKPSSVEAYEDKAKLQTELSYDGDMALVKVIFDEPVVGVGQKREFSVNYLDASIVKSAGDVDEITVPRLADETEYESYLVRLKIPTSFGRASYVSPEPDNVLSDASVTTYYFNKSKLNTAGVTAAIGDFQIFSFDLTYHLQNPLAVGTKMEIALPPDTSFQKIMYESLNPLPDNVYQDADGNWMAIYGLAARERLDVRAIGTAQVYAAAWMSDKLSTEDREDNLKETEFWQVNDEKIREVAGTLKNPKEIYDYVVTTLTYNYEKVTEGPKRPGAVQALANPSLAICTEFTDLFIALARASGIPAREVNGYAYTDNSSLKPLSLVNDVLHAWPEYWDHEASIWRPVDPTWAKTTGGIDYFTKLDMRHVSFVMHGRSSTTPIPPGSYKLGANPQKDVFISFGQLTPSATSARLNYYQETTLPFDGANLVIDIVNPGPAALYSQKASIYFEDELYYEKDVEILLPFEKRKLEFTIPYGFLGSQMPEKARIVIGNTSHEYKTDKAPAVFRDLFSILLISGIGLLSVFIIVKKLRK